MPIRATSKNTTSGASSNVLPLPVGTQVGDLVVIFCASQDTTNALAGWQVNARGLGLSWINYAVFTKMMTSGDVTAGSVTLTLTGGTGATFATAAAISSPRSDVVQLVDVQQKTGAGTITTPAFTQTPHDIILSFAAARNTTAPTFSRASTATLRESSSDTGAASALWSESEDASGAVTFTTSGGNAFEAAVIRVPGLLPKTVLDFKSTTLVTAVAAGNTAETVVTGMDVSTLVPGTPAELLVVLSEAMNNPGVAKGCTARVRDGGPTGTILATQVFTDAGDATTGDQQTWRAWLPFTPTTNRVCVTLQNTTNSAQITTARRDFVVTQAMSATPPWAAWPLDAPIGTLVDTGTAGASTDWAIPGSAQALRPALVGTGYSMRANAGACLARATIGSALAMTGSSTSMSLWASVPSGNSQGIWAATGSTNGIHVGIGAGTVDSAGRELIVIAENVAWQPTGYTFPAGAGNYHIGVTRNGNTWIAYVNGTQVATGSVGFANATGYCSIGGRSDGARVATNSDVDSVAFYNTTLSAARIAAHASGGPTAQAADSPVSLLSLDEDPYLGGRDLSGNGRTLVVDGTPPSASAVAPLPGIGGAPRAFGNVTGGLRTAATYTQPTTVTYETWVYPTATYTANPTILMGFGGSGGSGLTSQLYLQPDGKAAFSAYLGQSAIIIQTAAALPQNQWTHLVGSVGAAGMKLRVNKVTVATDARTSALSATSGYFYVRQGGPNASTGTAPVLMQGASAWRSQVADSVTDADYDAAMTSNAAPIKVTGERWSAGWAGLDGTARTAIRIAGERWTAARVGFDGTIPVRTPIKITGERWTAGRAGLDGAVKLRVPGERWAAAATMLDGTMPGQPIKVLGERWTASTAFLDGILHEPGRTDTDELSNGRKRVGYGLDATQYPVKPLPFGLYVEPMRIVAQQLPRPTLVDGRPT